MEALRHGDLQTTTLNVDSSGRVYFFNDVVLRGISDEYIVIFKEMFETGLINELNEKQLIPKTMISNYKIDIYKFVIESEKILYWNYSHEWSFDMLKDLAIMTIEVNAIANKYGFELKDPHVDNVVFNMNKPQYIDIGSFQKIKNKYCWSGYREFYSSFMVPLKLMSFGFIDIARRILSYPKNTSLFELYMVEHPILCALFGRRMLNKVFFLQDSFKKLNCIDDTRLQKHKYSFILKKLKLLTIIVFHGKLTEVSIKELQGIQFCKIKTAWGDYHSNKEIENNYRFNRIIELISTFKDINTVIEIASNQGLFARYLLEKMNIKTIIATDYDEVAVNKMYLQSKHLSNMLPLIMDFLIVGDFTEHKKSVLTRTRGDLIIALAIMHHLLLSQKINIDDVLSRLSSFTNKYIVAEFMPLGLYAGDLSATPAVPSFYNIEWFRNNFSKHFNILVEEELEINRVLFIGIKRWR